MSTTLYCSVLSCASPLSQFYQFGLDLVRSVFQQHGCFPAAVIRLYNRNYQETVQWQTPVEHLLPS